MAEFIVLHATAGVVPSLGTTGPADVYRGDHADGLAARQAAAAEFNVGPGVTLWSIPIGQLTAGSTSVSCS